MLAVFAMTIVPQISVAAKPSPKPISHFGASGPYSGLKYVGSSGGGYPAKPPLKKKPLCRTKACKPLAKATP